MAWRILLDGEFSAYIDDMDWPLGYVQWQLPVGDYRVDAEIAARTEGVALGPAESIEDSAAITVALDCESRREYYLELQLDDDGTSPGFMLVSDKRREYRNILEKETRRRDLILSELSGSAPK